MKCEHDWRFIEWIKCRVIAVFYCTKCLKYNIKWSDFPLTMREIKKRCKQQNPEWSKDRL